MPNWISKDGVFHPAKEKTGLMKNGEPYIYEGADRAALFELYEIDKSGKTTTLGIDFRKDVDFIRRVKDLGYKDMEEYLLAIGYDKEQVEKDFNAKASIIAKHELPKRVKEIEVLGGGLDFSGSGKHRLGGFGVPPVEG